MNEGLTPENKESKKDELEISATHSYFNEKTNQVENIDININLNKKLDEYINFYKLHSIDHPSDLRESIKEIWEENKEEIKKLIEEKGFNDLLIIPENLSVKNIKNRMVNMMGYYGNLFNSTDEDFNKNDFKSEGMDNTHLILLHNAQNLRDNPELIKTLGIKGEDIDLNKILNLEEYLVFQRKYVIENRNHLDYHGTIWLSTKFDGGLLNANWMPISDKLFINKELLDRSRNDMGYRECEKFYKKSV